MFHFLLKQNTSADICATDNLLSFFFFLKIFAYFYSTKRKRYIFFLYFSFSCFFLFFVFLLTLFLPVLFRCPKKSKTIFVFFEKHVSKRHNWLVSESKLLKCSSLPDITPSLWLPYAGLAEVLSIVNITFPFLNSNLPSFLFAVVSFDFFSILLLLIPLFL